jgi:hypothetical protein
MLQYSHCGRRLKRAQMQGGTPGTHPQDGCRVRRTPGTPQRVPERSNAADGPFSAACCKQVLQGLLRRGQRAGLPEGHRRVDLGQGRPFDLGDLPRRETGLCQQC